MALTLKFREGQRKMLFRWHIIKDVMEDIDSQVKSCEG